MDMGLVHVAMYLFTSKLLLVFISRVENLLWVSRNTFFLCWLAGTVGYYQLLLSS